MEPKNLTLPGPARARLHQAFLEAQAASMVVNKFNEMMATTMEMLGLDPNLGHSIEWSSGVVTPADPAPTASAPEALTVQ